MSYVTECFPKKKPDCNFRAFPPGHASTETNLGDRLRNLDPRPLNLEDERQQQTELVVQQSGEGVEGMQRNLSGELNKQARPIEKPRNMAS